MYKDNIQPSALENLHKNEQKNNNHQSICFRELFSYSCSWGGVGDSIGGGGGEDRTNFKSNPTIIPITPAVIASLIENP